MILEPKQALPAKNFNNEGLVRFVMHRITANKYTLDENGFMMVYMFQQY